MYLDSCLVEIAPDSSWHRVKNSHAKALEDDDAKTTCSGVLIGPGHGYILTHGSILLKFLENNQHVLERLLKNGHIPGNTFQGQKARVTLERRPIQTPKNKTRLRTYAESLFRITNSRRIDRQQEYFSGGIELVWRAERFSKCVKQFLPESDDWSFFEDPEKNSEKSEKEKKDEIDPKLIANLLPFFVLIKLTGWPKMGAQKLTIIDKTLHVGDGIMMTGTPFGSMSPSVFLNCVSQGIICNLIGSQQELILTDARCIPGCEGGPIYSGKQPAMKGLAGIVVSALCWKANEWIGLSLACNIKEVLGSLNRVMQYPEIMASIQSTKPTRTTSPVKTIDANGHRAISRDMVPVALVKCGGSWGSGVLINQSEALVLTCGHVLNDMKNGVKVRFDQPTVKWFNADVVYRTPNGYAFDIGVIKLTDYQPFDMWPDEIAVADNVKEGEECLVVGHAIFGQHLNLFPSVTSGIVSKVVTSHNFPVMLQSTCTVNAGASGGPLLSKAGGLLGIVVCNARDTVTGASYPNINLSVPAETICPVIEEYTRSSDPSVFNVLNLNNTEIMALWKLTETPQTFQGITSNL